MLILWRFKILCKSAEKGTYYAKHSVKWNNIMQQLKTDSTRQGSDRSINPFSLLESAAFN
jgi:hypothetical protein